MRVLIGGEKLLYLGWWCIFIIHPWWLEFALEFYVICMIWNEMFDIKYI